MRQVEKVKRAAPILKWRQFTDLPRLLTLLLQNCSRELGSDNLQDCALTDAIR